MGFFKELGNVVGTLAGSVVGGTVQIVGEITDCNVIKEVGVGVFNASKATGNLVGKAADGATGIIGGVISKDSSAIDNGFKELGNVAITTVSGVATGVGTIATNAFEIIDGVANGDEEKIKDSTKTLFKAVAISTLTIGVLDCMDIVGADGADFDMVENDMLEHNTGEHYVQPHYVDPYVRDDGVIVGGYWRDGDANTSVDLDQSSGGGYIRSNPSRV